MRQPVRGPHPVRDVFGGHAEAGAQFPGGQGVEGRGGLLGRRLVHAATVWALGCDDYGLFGQEH
ncbi:hypothetical protein GCM10010515_06500 [Streptomyces fructofermentans]|uniref:Uncharacterized protein n=1 Tax=Streptomyces fructofermentans TaxID=152141 RepID=A0A918N5L3_9ACTN|nr:hypothetical protein GCM10010515_06500 [Streptomyces fructofermentans]